MDISTFRWILVIVGVVIIVGIALFHNIDKKRKPRASRKRVHASRNRREPSLERGRAGGSGQEHPDGEEGMQTELDIGGAGDAGARIEPTLDPEPEKPPVILPDKIVTLFLQARDDHVITGVDLLDAAMRSGLVFGTRDIFHRINEEDVEPIFSMANLINPGTFDKTSWNTMEVRGVTLFMALPGPVNALDAWDAMLATSRRLAELLHADLLDDSHSVFTRQRSKQIRDELREYDRQKNQQS